jgi:cytochrome c oxidase subunit 3
MSVSTTEPPPEAIATGRRLSPVVVAMWVFLATEAMFFTGLIASQFVLRAGSAPTAYSNLRPPGADLSHLNDSEAARLRTSAWPRPFDVATNPLDPALTGLLTLLLIASAVTMSQSVAAWRRGDRRRASGRVLVTLGLGALFLAGQLVEYDRLARVRKLPIGVSATGHFRPDSSVFASNFYLLTGCHALHVAAGLVVLGWLWFRLRREGDTPARSQALELGGLYWHFVDVVWLVLFACVYLI